MYGARFPILAVQPLEGAPENVIGVAFVVRLIQQRNKNGNVVVVDGAWIVLFGRHEFHHRSPDDPRSIMTWGAMNRKTLRYLFYVSGPPIERGPGRVSSRGS